MRSLALAFLISCALSAPLGAKGLPRTLPPVDQCKGDKSFTQFRSALKTIVAKKDHDAFVKLLAPDVIVNFGGAAGPAAFQEQWNFEERDDPEGIWSLLKTMLTLGCARDGGVRVIPSLTNQLGPYADDVTDEVAVILPGAKLYKETGVESGNPKIIPRTLAAVTSRAGDLVTGVRLPDGRNGFIADGELYEPLGYRMVVEKRRGNWTITAFVAGD